MEKIESNGHVITSNDQNRGSQLSEIIANSMTIGLLESLWWISMLTLVFSGPIASYIGTASLIIMVGSVISSTIIAFSSSYKGSIGIIQDVPVAILALISSQIVSRLQDSAPPEVIFITILATISIAGIGTGLFMLLLGYFQLGNIIRFFPFPVLAGFLGGTGWLLLLGGISASLPTGNINEIFSPAALPFWIPALVLGYIAYAISERYPSPLLIPIILICGVAVFYAVAFGSGYTFSELTEAGWLIGGVSIAPQLEMGALLQFSSISWSQILIESGSLAVLAVASAIGMMLNNSGFELTVDKEFDLNRDLRVHGIANLFGGLSGGWPTYVTPAWSTLNARDTENNALTGLLAPIASGVILLFATQLFDYLPRLLGGSMVVYLGLLFLIEWVIVPAKRLPRLEYGILLLILLTIAFFGLLQGVAAGLIMAILLFVVNYSRIDAYKPLMSGVHQQSRVTRIAEQRDYLRMIGKQTQIMRLEGYLFFGSANSIIDKIRHLIEETDIKSLILDFDHVSGIDSTTQLSFSKIAKLLKRHHITLYLTSLSEEMIIVLITEGELKGADNIQTAPSVDQALETIENKALLHAGYDPKAPLPSIERQMQTILPDASNIEQLLGLLEELTLPDQAVLMEAGDPADDMFFVKEGLVTAQLNRENGKVIRLETMGTGRAVGEIGFYLNQERTASVVSDGPSVVYHLTKARLKWIEENHPDVASTLHRLIVNLLSDRVTHLVGVVDVLQR